MIYIQNTPNPQTIRIPRNYMLAPCDLFLIIRPSMGGEWMQLCEFADDAQGGYYTITLPTCNLRAGEYRYKVATEDAIVLSQGLLMVKNDNAPAIEVSQYGSEIEYTQYGK